MLFINDNSRVGPNPANPSVNCELWTADKLVYSTALAALMSSKKVTVRYVDSGSASVYCDVDYLRVSAD